MYVLSISDFYSFVYHLVEGAKGSKFVRTSANFWSHFVTLRVHFRQAEVTDLATAAICHRIESGKPVAGNTNI
jgi:hypothetical protein